MTVAKKYNAAAMKAAMSPSPSFGDVKSLGSKVNMAKAWVKNKAPMNYQARIEVNKKQPTGIEPVVGPETTNWPTKSKVVARSTRYQGGTGAVGRKNIKSGGASGYGGRKPAEDDATNPRTGKPYWDENAPVKKSAQQRLR